MRLVGAVVSSAVVIGFVGCGGGSPKPSPLPPSITTPNNIVYVGQTVLFVASGTGTIRWGGDAPAVASVDAATGRVTGVGIGRVTIWAENEGGRTTRLLRVLPSFAGTWRGSYVVENCQASGVFAALTFCGTVIRIGDRLDMAMIFVQTEDHLTGGSFLLATFPGTLLPRGSIPGTLTDTSVGEDGQIRLAGSVEPFFTNNIRLSLENMRLESPNPGVMVGQYEQVWLDTTASGSGRVFARIDSMTRELGGPTLGISVPPPTK
jgi:Big-like domain-containing protein